MHSDQMGNKGAYITLTKDLKPKFTTYEAVVSLTTSVLTWCICIAISFVASSECSTNAICQSTVWTRILMNRFLSFYLVATYYTICSYLCTSLLFVIKYNSSYLIIVIHKEHYCNWLCKNQPSSYVNWNSFYCPSLIANYS